MAKKARPPRKSDISSLHPFGHLKQSSILDHLQPMGKPKKRQIDNISEVNTSGAELKRYPEEHSEVQKPHIERLFEKNDTLDLSEPPYSLSPAQRREEEAEVGPDWDQKANNLLRKHFGYSGLKSFQKEALGAWFAHQDCLVLAATGSGKSLCFQIPALLTGKVVVVISPLISLMHDQCLKLAKHGISACFLGSGQPDNSVEKKAMNGMYSIIYVCPETLLRLIIPLQRLAENRGIALFAIDEVHCVSKWGHDFRPDYRRMSVLRESFSASRLDFLKFDIPIMALTATATDHVREDILKSLKLSKDAKVVLTTFFRPNLQFSTMHSRTSPSSYVKDFQELVKVYSNKKTTTESSGHTGSVTENLEDSSEDSDSMSDSSDVEEQDDELNSHSKKGFSTSNERQLSVEFLENDFDDIQTADDFDVSCGEFCGTPLVDDVQFRESTELPHSSPQPAESSQSMSCSLEQGPTIIYVPTRKQTVAIAKYLRVKGVKAEPYNAALPKSHLRRVHKEFHEDALEVVVATIAFGMGIDKLNVRRIIHYGWPQSLEAYYQEAGRAGRDGKLADCTLYANFSKIPSLLPNKRNEEQKKNAYKMLADCYRYGMNTSICRAKVLVEYFGEVFHQKRCMSCDVCRNGPPELQNLKDEANIFMQVIASHYKQQKFAEYSYDDLIGGDTGTSRLSERPTLRLIVTKIRGHSQQFLASDQLWWRGLARLLQDKGFIREGGKAISVQIKCPEPTNQGLKFLESDVEQDFYAYPEADMLLSADKSQQPFSSFSEWGKGWADPEIRKQRLARKRGFKKPRKSRKRKTRKQSNSMTAKERISARLSKWKK